MSDYAVLEELGLSKTAIACYASLFEDGAATASQLAGRLSQSRTGLYRVLERMGQQGFITSLRVDLQPTYFDAELLDKALQRHAEYQRQLLSELIKEQAEILAKRSGKAIE
jgi:sugar-specific transcriptional regulator TrmB